MLNPRQIEAFRTVIVTGGITAAAQALNVTQPAVTRLIQDLQYALGLPLFVKRAYRDERYISDLAAAVETFNSELQDVVAKVRAYGAGP